MEILRYSKVDPLFWDITTQEQSDAAFLGLFKYLDEDWQCYGRLFELPEAKAEPAKASDDRKTWSLDALAFIMGQTFKRPSVEFERTELVRRAKELGLLGEERP